MAKAPTLPTEVTAEPLTALRALSDGNRLRIFMALRDKERCVSDLVLSEGMAQPLVSHHLAVLGRAGLVQTRRADGFTFYAVDPEGMAAAARAVGALLDPGTLGPLARLGANPDCCR